MLRDTQLFEQALGLGHPWHVMRSESEFDAERRRLDVYLDFERGATFACPECAVEGCKAYDSEEKTWRHLSFFQHEAYPHARIPRGGVRQVEVPWARPGSGFTLLFEALVLALVRDMPAQAVARIVGEHDTRIWRVVHHYVDEAPSETDVSEVRAVGMDETANKRGLQYIVQYITLFMDLDASRLLFATDGRDASTLATFRADLERHNGRADQIEELCLDMSPAFIKGTTAAFPEASLTFDRFHVMHIVNNAVGTVRREERKSRPELKGTRYVWMKNPENLTKRQRESLAELDVRRLALKTVRAYHLRLTCQGLWALEADEAASFLKKWYFWATHSRLRPMADAARTIRRHQDGILRWFQSRVSNGLLEGVNSLVQAAKAKARGYRSTRNLIAIAYLIAGKLTFRPLPT